jgi:hypothetical protein
MRLCGNQTEAAADAGAANTFLLQDTAPLSGELARKLLHYGRFSHTLNCLVERFRYRGLKSKPPFRKLNRKGRLVPTAHVVGYSQDVLISSLQPGQRFYPETDWSVAVPGEKADEALRFVRDALARHKICLPIFGVILRFVRPESDSLIGLTAVSSRDEKPMLVIEFPVYDPQSLRPSDHARIDAPYEDLIRELIARFGARPHWGKNRDWVFGFAARGGAYGDRLERFRRVVSSENPRRTFFPVTFPE